MPEILFIVPIKAEDRTFSVHVVRRTPQEIHQRAIHPSVSDGIVNDRFIGAKMHHPFKVEKQGQGRSANLKYIDEFTDDKLAQEIADTVDFDVKHDGACGAIIYNSKSQSWIPYTRFDVKRDRASGKFAVEKIGSDWIPCENKPDEDLATHWPHQRPCTNDSKAYQYQLQAFEMAKNTIAKWDPKSVGTHISVEYMGKKFNPHMADMVTYNGAIIIHGSLGLEIPRELRNFYGFRRILEEIPCIEGIIAHTRNGPMKIRRECFDGMDWNRKLGDNSVLEKYNWIAGSLSMAVALTD